MVFMPLYEYACEQCSHEFEALVFDGEEVECPKCRGRQLHRNLSLPGRPQTVGTSLPVGGCDPSLPPCGRACRRWPGK
jgi:putative FmdB family regulatory protein